MNPQPEQIGRLLERVRGGDPEAHKELVDLVYPELRRLARALLSKERAGHTLGPTGSALVNSIGALMRPEVAQQELAKAKDEKDVIAIFFRDMRQVLIDYARARNAQRRPPKSKGLPLEAARKVADDRVFGDMYSLEMQGALEALRNVSPDNAYAIELYYSVGMTYPELAAAMGITESKVRTRLAHATAWLKDYLENGASAAAN